LIIPGQDSYMLQGGIHSLTMKLQKKLYLVTMCCILVKTHIHYASVVSDRVTIHIHTRIESCLAHTYRHMYKTGKELTNWIINKTEQPETVLDLNIQYSLSFRTHVWVY